MATFAPVRTAFSPAIPQNFAELGISESLVLDLMLRRMVIEGNCTLASLGRSLRDGLARPASPRRWTFPITALRVTPPSARAIWLADSPSVQRFLSCSTRSSVQFINWVMKPLPDGFCHKISYRR